MNRIVLAGIVLVTGAAIFVGLTAPSASPSPDPTAVGGSSVFTVDGVHSSMIFKIRHMGVANFMGRFNKISGTYSYDEAAPENASFDITVPVASIDTNSEGRDRHLKSPDFFNVAEHPELRFKSTAVKVASPGELHVTGDLTLHGVTKSITVPMKLIGVADTPRGYKSGFDTTFTIKRSDFDMSTYIEGGGLGDEVEITVCLEGNRT